jgi:hypothetical protein
MVMVLNVLKRIRSNVLPTKATMFLRNVHVQQVRVVSIVAGLLTESSNIVRKAARLAAKLYEKVAQEVSARNATVTMIRKFPKQIC